MMNKIMLLLVAVVSSTACVAIPVKRQPELSRSSVSSGLVRAPTIRLEIHDHSSVPKRVSRAVDRARRRLPYLSRTDTKSSINHEYTIEVSIDHTTMPGPINELSALSFFVVPAWRSSTVVAKATVRDSDGGTVGAVEATGKNIEIAQMHLLWIAPVAIPLSFHVDRQMWNKTILNAFVQAGEIVAKHRADPREPHQDPPGRAESLPVAEGPCPVLILDRNTSPALEDSGTATKSPYCETYRTVSRWDD